MDKMGGLSKLMPYTAICFLIGTLAISALPPFNGFVSEWFTYQSLFSLSRESSILFRLIGPFAIIMLALTGALAALCFVKVYGISFGGSPRSEQARLAKEVPKPMLYAMGILAIMCILLGLGASFITPIIAQISTALSGMPPMVLAENGVVVANEPANTALSMPMIAIMLISFIALPFIYYVITKPHRLAQQTKGSPWACGYAYEQDMATSTSGFTRPLRTMFKPLYQIRQTLDPAPLTHKSIQGLIKGSTKAEPFWENKITMPIAYFMPKIGTWIQKIQNGNFQLYCLYFVITVVLLLIITAML